MSGITRIHKRKKSKNKGFMQLTLFLLVLIGLFFIFIQLSKVNLIDVEGNQRYTKDEILDMIGIKKDDNVIDIFLNKEYNNKDFLYINDINISYTGIDHILVTVDEKDIIGYIPYMNKFLCIDYDGYIIDYVTNVYSNVPIIEGIIVNEFTVNEKLDVNYSLIDTFILFYHVKENYKIDINHIELVNNSIDDIVIQVGNIEVIFGDKERFNNKIEVLIEIIKNIDQQDSGILDISGDLEQVIFKKSNNIVN